MSDQSKTKKQLIAEIKALRKENEGLRRAEDGHKRDAEALRRSEKRLRLTFDQSPIGVVLSGPNHEYLKANSRFCEFLGYSQEEVTSLTVLDVTHPDDLETTWEAMKNLLNGKADSIDHHEKRYLRKDGTVVWGRVSVRPLRDKSGQILFRLAMVEDITEQKKAEEALKRSEREKAAILDAMSEYVIFQDKDHKVLWANRAAVVEAAKSGISELIDRRCHEVWGRSDKECEGCPVINAVKTKKFKEATAVTPGGRVRLVRASPVEGPDGEAMGAVSVSLDITEQKRAEEALRKSEALLAQTQRITKLGGWEYDVKKKRITFTEETYRIYGVSKDYDPSDIEQDVSFYGPQAQAVIKGAFWRAVNEGVPYDLELPFTTAKGKKMWVRTTAAPVWKKGKVVRVAGNIIDITQRKEAELEREKLIAQLQKALAEVKKLSGLLPICASCKKIRNDQGYWEQIETYIGSRSEADFSHGICPECRNKLYPELKNTGWD